MCVVIAADGDAPGLRECLQSVQAHTPASVHVAQAEPSPAAVNSALEQLAPADAIVLLEPCLVAEGWLERLARAARADTNTASASALASAGTELALSHGSGRGRARAGAGGSGATLAPGCALA